MISYCKNIFLILTVISLSAFFAACSSSDSNGLSGAFPEGFSVSSPYASSSSDSSSRLNSNDLIVAATEEPTVPEDMASAAEKVSSVNTMLNASSMTQCNFLFDFFGQVYRPQCFGPELDYTDHPDGGGSGKLPTGDLGIWLENETITTSAGTETIPCAVAKLNELIGKVEQRVDFSIYIFGWMMCVAKVAGEDVLPLAGETKDYASLLAANVAQTDFPLTIEAATITRNEDCAGHPQYRSTLTGSINDNNKTITISINMLHTQENSANTVYNGIIWSTYKGNLSSGGNCGPSGVAMDAVAIRYQRATSTDLRAEVEAASFCDSTANPFTSDYHIDSANTYNASTNLGGWADNFNYFLTNHDTANRLDSYVYKWQAGYMDSHARILAGRIEADSSTNLLSGCSYYGYGPLASNANMAERMICNWAGPGNSHTGVSKVQRQCVNENSTTGKLESTAAQLRISYAPVNSCSYDGLATATFGGSGAAIADNLLALDQVSFTGPVLPTICLN